MARKDGVTPSIGPSWLGGSNGVGPFRNPQSFTLVSVHHLLDKLRWDMSELKQMQWDATLPNWRQCVSFKAIDCATSAWHLAEWFQKDIRAIEPIERACAFLGIKGHDAFRPLTVKQLRARALVQCPELEICQIIAIASKHYEVEDRPRDDIRTSIGVGVAHRDDEPYARQVMMLNVFVGEERRNMIEVLEICHAYWKSFLGAARPGSTWQPPA